VTTKTLQAITCTAIVLITTICAPEKGNAQQPSDITEVSHATEPSNAREYLRVALYFHQKELRFRAKAQNTIDWYANHSGKYPMATKTITRADAAARQYNEYSSKADENAKLAATYDEMLAELGYKPIDPSPVVVSLKSLYETFVGGNRTVGN